MSYQLIDNATVTEPVSLAEAKAYMQIDADYASDNGTIGLMITAARTRLEQYLNIGLASRLVTVQWSGFPVDLPLSPTGGISSVKDKDGAALVTSDYTLSGYNAKKLFINSVAESNYNYWYSTLNSYVEISPVFNDQPDGFYTVEYTTGYSALPGGLKQALLAEIDYLYKLRGMPVTDMVSPNAAMLASGFSRNLVL